MLSQVPDVCFVTSQSCAVDSGLLTSANADRLTVFCEAYRVGLCIFQSDQRDDQVAFCFFRQFFVFCYDVFQQSFVDFEVVSALFECDTEYLFYFLYFRNVVGVDFYDIVVAVSFGFQDFQCFVCVAGSDDTVGNFSFDQSCCCFVTNIAQCDPVAEGGHSVCTSCSCISQCQRGFIQTFDIIYEASLFQVIAHRCTYCCGCGRNVFEGCCCGHAQSFFDFLYQLPAVKSIQEVDVTGSAGQDFDGQFLVTVHVDFCRFLVGVTTIFQFEFFHCKYPLSLMRFC